jgi:hypothetical protein
MKGVSLKSVGIPANAAAKGKLLPGGRVLDVEGTLFTLQLLCSRSCRKNKHVNTEMLQ